MTSETPSELMTPYEPPDYGESPLLAEQWERMKATHEAYLKNTHNNCPLMASKATRNLNEDIAAKLFKPNGIVR